MGFAAGFFSLRAATLPFAAAQQTATGPNAPFAFPQGVASGDPTPDSVVIWTRAEDISARGQAVTLRAQMATAADFATLIVDEKVTVGPDSDNCLRLHIHGLEPGTAYFYRFLAGPSLSPTGRTRTAPAPGEAPRVRFAVAACQSYEQAHYGAWAHMLQADAASPPDQQLDFVLFLGDFIYEVRGDRWDQDMRNPTWLRYADGKVRDVPPFPHGSAPWPSTSWNVHPGATNAVSLDDYRHLYRLYLSDPYLRAARARWPFVCTWDDHEFSNDGWQAHDTYFDAGGKPAQRRKAAANRAWFEYIPALLTRADAPGPAHDFRAVKADDSAFAQGGYGPDGGIDPNPDNVAAVGSMTIYRSLSWGRTLDLFLTDNRSYKTPPLELPLDKAGKKPALPPIAWVKTLDAGRTANGGAPPATLPGSDTPNPRAKAAPGTVLGAAQKAWFKGALKASQAQWKVWANSFPALPVRIDASNIPFSGLADSCLGLDAWNGYPSERDELLKFIAESKIANVISCAGDHHAHFAGRLIADGSAGAAALEFATAGISSEPLYEGLERATRSNAIFNAIAQFPSNGRRIENWNYAMRFGSYAALIRALTGSAALASLYHTDGVNPGLDYADTNANGYAVLTLGREVGEAVFVTVGGVETDHGPKGAPVLRTARFQFAPWAGGDAPRLSEPAFTGVPPFPFVET
jgi:alkaline phosphatase D